jgi:hypothetical protein
LVKAAEGEARCLLLSVAVFAAVALGTAAVSGAGAPFCFTSAISVSSFLWILYGHSTLDSISNFQVSLRLDPFQKTVPGS